VSSANSKLPRRRRVRPIRAPARRTRACRPSRSAPWGFACACVRESARDF
jgi:hypothetical protein